jgi:hypothetical protein
MTYEEISKVNESIQTTDIKGKNYAEVNQRIKAFRMLYPEGYIKTEVLSLENGICVIRAEVGNDGKVLGTGTAYEKEGSTFINKTSYIENCETSAVGRALGMLGIGIDVSVASAEEVQNAMLNQNIEEKITKVQLESIRLTLEKNPDKMTEEGICKYFKIKKLEDMTVGNLREFTKMINEKKK